MGRLGLARLPDPQSAKSAPEYICFPLLFIYLLILRVLGTTWAWASSGDTVSTLVFYQVKVTITYVEYFPGVSARINVLTQILQSQYPSIFTI